MFAGTDFRAYGLQVESGDDALQFTPVATAGSAIRDLSISNAYYIGCTGIASQGRSMIVTQTGSPSGSGGMTCSIKDVGFIACQGSGAARAIVVSNVDSSGELSGVSFTDCTVDQSASTYVGQEVYNQIAVNGARVKDIRYTRLHVIAPNTTAFSTQGLVGKYVEGVVLTDCILEAPRTTVSTLKPFAVDGLTIRGGRIEGMGGAHVIEGGTGVDASKNIRVFGTRVIGIGNGFGGIRHAETAGFMVRDSVFELLAGATTSIGVSMSATSSKAAWSDNDFGRRHRGVRHSPRLHQGPGVLCRRLRHVRSSRSSRSRWSILQLAPNTTYAAANVVLTKDITIEGHGNRSTIIDGGSNVSALTFPGVSAGVTAQVTIQDIGFKGGTTACVRLNRDRIIHATFIGCRFSNFVSRGIEVGGSDVVIERCDFQGDGTAIANGVYHFQGSEKITVDKCRFRFLNRGFYCTAAGGAANDVKVTNSHFDGGWMYLKTLSTGTTPVAHTGSGGTVTYTATTVTDTGMNFLPAGGGVSGSSPTANWVRVLTVKRAGTFTAMTKTTVTDTGANFTTAPGEHGDLLRTGTKWAVVDEVVSATQVKVEEWMDSTSYDVVEPPAVGAAYTVYGLVLGKPTGVTATTLTVTAWYDWDGTPSTPAAGTLYEVLPTPDYCGIYLDKVQHPQVIGNTVRRSWADSIAIQTATMRNAIVMGNEVYDGQDVGLTINGTGPYCEHIVSNNRITHEGTAGIFCSAPGTQGIGNTITDNGWFHTSVSNGGGLALSGCSNSRWQGNRIKRVNMPSAFKGVSIYGTTDNVYLDNDTEGYGGGGSFTDLNLIGTTVTNIRGRFQPGTVVTLASSAVGPRGEFSGAGAPVIPASPGSTYLRTDGAAGSTLYVKETASSSTVWQAK